MAKEIKNLICFSYYGEGMSVAQHAIDEGLDAVLAIIQDHKDILTEGEKGTEDPKEKALRLKIGKNMVPTIDAKTCVKNLLKIPEGERGSYFLFFDINVGWKFATELYDKGFEGNFPTEDDRKFEVERDKGKDFVKEHYPDLKVAEVQEFKSIDDAIEFLGTTEDSWVLKGYDDLCETVVPNKQDCEKDKVQLISALKNGKSDYEKSGFLLEKMIYDQCEVTPEAVFHDGNLVCLSLDIELKRKRAGNLGKMCGCAANIIVPLTMNDPIAKYAFPQKVFDMAKERKGVFLWDASILNDPKDGSMYFGEFCPNRYGWDSIQTEMEMAGGVKNYLNAIVNDKFPFEKGTYGFAVRMFPDGNDPDIALDIDHEAKPHVWPMYVYSDKEHVMMSGYSDDACVVTAHAGSIMEAIDKSYDIVDKNISLANAVYRPKEDILSTGYEGSLIKRFNYVVENALIDDTLFEGSAKNMYNDKEGDELIKKLMGQVAHIIHEKVSHEVEERQTDFDNQLAMERKGFIRKLQSIYDENDGAH